MSNGSAIFSENFVKMFHRQTYVEIDFVALVTRCARNFDPVVMLFDEALRKHALDAQRLHDDVFVRHAQHSECRLNAVSVAASENCVQQPVEPDRIPIGLLRGIAARPAASSSIICP